MAPNGYNVSIKGYHFADVVGARAGEETIRLRAEVEELKIQQAHQREEHAKLLDMYNTSAIARLEG